MQLPADADAKAVKEHAAKVKRCRETGDWSGLLIQGATPTKFVMRPIAGSQLRWLTDQLGRTDEFRIGLGVALALLFRCAFVDVHNLGIEVDAKTSQHRDLGSIASVKVTNLLDSIDASIVAEIADAAFERARDLNPL